MNDLLLSRSYNLWEIQQFILTDSLKDQCCPSSIDFVLNGRIEQTANLIHHFFLVINGFFVDRFQKIGNKVFT